MIHVEGADLKSKTTKDIISIGSFMEVLVLNQYLLLKKILWINEVAYKMPNKIEQYNSLSNLEKEHTKSVYLRNEEDKKRGVEYAMNKILGFYKECLELVPEYFTRLEDKGGVI
nr:protein kinase-like domain, concanavalin A-like lectin/glucanase domain protein [Tanacetum cinerariifolium]